MPFAIKLTYLIILCFLNCTHNSTITQSENSGTNSLGKTVQKVEGNPLVVFHDSKGNYWFAGSEKGVYKYQENKLTLYTKEDGLCSYHILGIQEDKMGNIYFDSTEGVGQFNGTAFNTLEVIDSPMTRNNWVLNPDDLWFRIGWQRDGPYRYDGKKLYFQKFPENPQGKAFNESGNRSFSAYDIYSTYKDNKDNLWFGTGEAGLCRFDGESLCWLDEEHLKHTPEGGAFGIRSIVEDQEGHFWICNPNFNYIISDECISEGDSKLIKYERSIGIAELFEMSSTTIPYFMSIVPRGKHEIWFLSYEQGIWRYQNNKLDHFPIQLNNETIELFSMYKDHHDNLWVCSHHHGVFIWEGKKFVSFKT